MKEKDYPILLEKAVEAGKKRKYSDAIDLLLELTSETDNYPEAYMYLGRSYHVLGKYDLAVQALRYFVYSAPQSHVGHFFLGRAYISSGFPREGVHHLKKALLANPASIQIKGYLALAYLRLKRTEIAVRLFEEALMIQPDNAKLRNAYLNALFIKGVKVFHRGDTGSAENIFLTVRNGGIDHILIDLYLGMIYREKGEYEKALYFYEEAVKKSPKDELLLFRRAVTLFHLGRKNEAFSEINKLDFSTPESETCDPAEFDRILAVEHYQKGEFRKAIYHGGRVLKFQKNEIDMHLMMGESYRALNDLVRAENHFQRAIEKDRTSLEARYGLSVSLWLAGEFALMLNELKKIERINPGDDIASYYTVLCICRLKYSPADTIPAIQKELKKSGPDPYLYSALGDQYLRTGDFEAAEIFFRKAFGINKTFKEAYTGAIKALKKSGHPEKLIPVYRDFLSNYPEEAGARKQFILELFKQGKFDETSTEIEKILSSSGKSRKLLRILAASYRNCRKYREASGIYRRLLKDDPENEVLLKSLVFCLEKSGNRIHSIALIESGLKYLKNPTPELFLILGVLNFKQKNYTRASECFQYLLSRTPKDWRVYKNLAHVYEKQGMNTMADTFHQRADSFYQKSY